MTSVTHISFGILLTEFIFTSLGIEPNTSTLALSGLGALLPDIDTPKSSLGRILPISKLIEQRFGHRQITHSLLFIALCGAALLPLIFFANAFIYAALVIGITSHIMIDMANVSGVPFLYPSPLRYVFPPAKESRIEVNSKKEYILLAVLIFFVTLSTPLSFIGYKSLFYRISQTPFAAIEEAKKYSDTNLINVKVSGIWRRSQARVNGDFRILAVEDKGIIVLSRDNKTYYLTYSEFSAILINKISVILGPRISKRAYKKAYSYTLLDSIEIPKDAIVSGTIFYEGYENIKDILWSFEYDEYKVIRADKDQANKLIFSYCPAALFEKLKNRSIFVSFADLTITESRRSTA